jgi:fructose-1,6-bisphosphatase
LGSVNVQGEEQKKLDVVTNDVLKRALAFTGKVCNYFELIFFVKKIFTVNNLF